jgi:hypothetical protein
LSARIFILSKILTLNLTVNILDAFDLDQSQLWRGIKTILKIILSIAILAKSLEIDNSSNGQHDKMQFTKNKSKCDFITKYDKKR